MRNMYPEQCQPYPKNINTKDGRHQNSVKRETLFPSRGSADSDVNTLDLLRCVTCQGQLSQHSPVRVKEGSTVGQWGCRAGEAGTVGAQSESPGTVAPGAASDIQR